MYSDNKKDFAGLDFIWWTGIIEDKNDPLKLGRCKVRCVGWHSENKMDLPTEDLPWAFSIFPVNNTNPYAPKEGDMVFGFFLDGTNAQNPAILGVFPSLPMKAANIQEAFSDPRTEEQLKNSPRPPESKVYSADGSGISIVEKEKASNYPVNLDEPTTPRIARNDPESISSTFIEERKKNVVTGVQTVNSSWNEPETKYDAKYPYNNVIETESGHLLEFDDTPGKERIHLAHRNGSFVEYFPDGTKVEKITKDNYTIIMKDEQVYIMGKCSITVQGDAEIYVKKNGYLKFDGDVKVEAGGTYTVESGGNMKFVAPRIDWN